MFFRLSPDPRLMHYGSYETVFLKRMRARYGGPREGVGSGDRDSACDEPPFVCIRTHLFPNVL